VTSLPGVSHTRGLGVARVPNEIVGRRDLCGRVNDVSIGYTLTARTLPHGSFFPVELARLVRVPVPRLAARATGRMKRAKVKIMDK
jgi:hypothetical protein